MLRLLMCPQCVCVFVCVCVYVCVRMHVSPCVHVYEYNESLLSCVCFEISQFVFFQLPPMVNYSMAGRTYRYFEGEPLYPFGYGLSYTTFTYSDLSAPSAVAAGNNLLGQVRVQNTGSVDSDEVSDCFSLWVPFGAMWATTGWNLVITYWFVEAHANFFHLSNINDFMKYAVNIGLCLDAYEPVSFRLGMMVESTKPSSLIPVLVILTFSQSHRFTKMLKLLQLFCCRMV